MSKKRRTARSQQPVPARRSRRVEPARRQLPWARIALVAIAAVGASVLLVGAFVSSFTAKAYACSGIPNVAGQGADGTGLSIDPISSRHVVKGARITYPSCPPTSGDHYNEAGAGPLRAAFYGPSSGAPPGGWVHNLEHGFAVVLYRGEPDERIKASMQDFVRNGPQTRGSAACGIPSKVLAARFDDMSTPFAVVSWGRLLPLDEWDAARARAFAAGAIDATAPEPGAC